MVEDNVPQVVMRRVNLQNIPPLQLPEEYSIRSFCEGDERHWENLLNVAFDKTDFDFDKAMRSDVAFMPERVLFVVHKNVPVATASAWQVERFGPVIGYLHMVAALPEHRGKNLGFYISVAVLKHFCDEGRMEAVLQTDDFRLPAIKTYLKAGFEPLLIHENQKDRWIKIFHDIERLDLLEKFRPLIDGPICNVKI